MSERLTIPRPDDWHLHLRDGAMLAAVLPFTARQFARAIIMPNLTPPVTRTIDAVAYKARILDALPRDMAFEPLMTLYLTDHSDAHDIITGFRHGEVTAAKLYPAHATTNSAHGVSDIHKIMPVLEAMAAAGMPLLIHGEVTDPAVDIFDREAVFIDRVLIPLRDRLPSLKIVLEHITTAEAAAYVRDGGAGIAATITPHHLLINRTDIFRGGIRPHLYCLPIAKRERHRLAVRAAAVSGDPHFFLGTDSAPHAVRAKESACGCAGIFCAAAALEAYIQVFAEDGALDRFEAFASRNGPAFYGLPVNHATVTLERRPAARIPELIHVGHETLLPFHAGESPAWRIAP